MILDAFNGTRGSIKAPIMVVGEAYGEKEAQSGRPFMGSSGQELERMLKEAGIAPEDCFFTNVINARPDNNDFSKFLISNELAKKSKIGGVRGVYPTQLLQQGIEALSIEVKSVKPKMIFALGNWPLWALTDHANTKTIDRFKRPVGIDSWRGSHLYLRPGLMWDDNVSVPVLSTYHPAGVLRNWTWRHIAVHDFRRASKYLRGEKPWDDPRTFDWLIQPSPKEVRQWVDRFLSWPNQELELVLDLETYAGQIHILGVRDKTSCLCIPFLHTGKGGTTPVYSKWEFVSIYDNIRRLLTDPRVSLVGQNLIYDAQYLRKFFCYDPKISFDTMVAQYICFPAERKGLDFISSIYCRYYRYWKDERKESLANESTLDGCRYNCLDLEYTYENWKVLQRLLQRVGKERLFQERIELMHVLLDMMQFGVRIDTRKKYSQSSELEMEMAMLGAWIDGCIPPDLRPIAPKTAKGPWYDSSTQLMQLFYDKLGLDPVLDGKTGRRTLDKEAMEILSGKYPHFAALFGGITVRRSMATINNNVLKKRIDPDGRVRCAYGPAATASMRLNSTENVFGTGWNMQNILRDRDEALTLFNAIEELA